MAKTLLDQQETIEEALQLQKSGNVAEAIDLYEKLLLSNGSDARVQFHLGTAYVQIGQAEQGLALLDRVLSTYPEHVGVLINRGIALQSLGRNEEAVNSFSKAITIDSGNAGLYFYIGNALSDLKRSEEALASYDKALGIFPDFAEALCNRGTVLEELERLEEALASYDKALILKPNYAQAHFNRGNVLKNLDRLEEALPCFKRAAELMPNDFDAIVNYANALLELKYPEEALANYERAVAVEFGHAEVLCSQGSALKDLKRLDEALVSYEKALALKPDFPEAYVNRGNVLADLKRLDEALVSYEKALALKPDFPEAYVNRGNVLTDLKRLDEALVSYEKALALKPDLEFLFGICLHTKMKLCDWEGFAESVDQLVADISQGKPVTSPLALLGLVDFPDLHRLASRIYADKKFNNQDALGPVEMRNPNGKIRIGYYSSDFKFHPVAFAMVELFELHARSRFEVYGFSFGPDTNDEIRQRVAAAFDHFIDVREMSDREIARLSRELGIDIAIDLGGYTQGSRTGIFAERAAPIQVNYLGYPGTMNVDYIDYVIADEIVIPNKRRVDFTEKVVYLPNSYFVNDSQRKISDRPFTKEKLGLPEEVFVFCCFNNNYKILPATFDGWMRILKAVDGSVLWFAQADPTAVANLRKEAEQRGVDSNRLVFAAKLPAQDEHLARLRCADLFIDTQPYNAHATTSDALWAGLPVLTCMGQSFASRVAASLLNAINLPELITTTKEEYEAKAIELATHPDKLRKIKNKLEHNRLTTPLFDTKMFAKHIESAYVAMYNRYQSGLPPDVIEVKTI